MRKQEIAKEIAKVAADYEEARLGLEEGTTPERAAHLKKTMSKREAEYNRLCKEFNA